VTHFIIDVLPAAEGDALLVEWGDEANNGRMLIDGGRGGAKLNDALSAAFAARDSASHHFDVVVCSHMDADHIAGLLGLFGEPPSTFSVGDVWFNAFRHLMMDILGWKQSDRLEELVDRFVNARNDTRWNEAFGNGGAIVLPDRPADGASPPTLPTVTVKGMAITLLSPTVDRLQKVALEWPAAVRAARLDPPPDGDLPADASVDEDDDTLGFDEDQGVEPSALASREYTRDGRAPNGSSIAFIAEFADRRVLFGADAHAEVLEDTLRRWQPSGRLHFDAVKLSHHGSEKNLSPTLLEMVDSPMWIVSTNGNLHHHPDRRAIARLITRNVPTHLVFNYRSDETEEWARASRQMEYGFTAYHPPKGAPPGVRFDVISGASSPLP
jgi:hypothetical protein